MTRNYVAECYQHPHDDEMAVLYLQGLTVKQVAKRFGVSTSPVFCALKRKEVPCRKGGVRAWKATPEQKATVLDLYKGGTGTREIAKLIGCRSDPIRDLLRTEGLLHRRWGDRALTGDQIRDAVRAYESGSSQREIAEKYGVHKHTIGNYLKAQGVKTRDGKSLFGDRNWKEKVARRYLAGESQQQIAASLGVKQTTVSRALLSLGTPIRHNVRRGPAHGSWKGGRSVGRDGYMFIHLSTIDDAHLVPEPVQGSYIMEHRLVMARALGRPLKRSETVHHINGDRIDNRLENLQLRQGPHGNGIVVGCLDCGSRNVGAFPLG